MSMEVHVAQALAPIESQIKFHSCPKTKVILKGTHCVGQVCAGILRRHGTVIGLPPTFTIYGTEEQVQCCVGTQFS
jgi:hypothetical protein